MSSITLAHAHNVIEAAAAEADGIGVPMNIAVVDAGNNLTAFQSAPSSDRRLSARAR